MILFFKRLKINKPSLDMSQEFLDRTAGVYFERVEKWK